MSKLTTITTPLLAPKTMYSMPQNLLKDSGTNVEDFEDFTEWLVNHGSAADDAVNYKEGTQGVEVTADVGVAQEGEIQKSGLSWVIGDKEVNLWVYMADSSKISGGSCKIQLYHATGYAHRTEILYYFDDGWNLIHVGPDDWDLKGDADLDDVRTYLRLRHASSDEGVLVYDAMYMQQVHEPAIMLSFDDEVDSQYDKVFPIMRQRNMVGTAYVITDNVGGANSMTWAELLELQTAGWTIANHSKTHTNFTTLNEAEIEAELTDAKDALIANGVTGNGPYHVAYPGGGHDADTMAAMADTNMLTGRTVQTARQPILPFERPYDIPIMFDLDDGTSLATAKAHIDDVVANGKLCVAYGHKIEAAAGAQTWAESDFIELCNYIAQKRMICLTIEDAYQLQSGSRTVRRAG